MNFQSEFKKGQEGKNIGLSTGIKGLDKAIRGVQRKSIIGIAASPKVGKTTLADYSFVLSPYEDAIAKGILDNVHWIYFSFEVDRVKKEFKFAAHYFWKDYGISNFTYKGKNYSFSSDYLLGKMIDDQEELIPVSPDHKQILIEIYENRIVPLFGRYNSEGKQTQKGKITFIGEKDNPTGMRNFLMHYAKQHGNFIYETYYTEEEGKKVTRQRIIGYKANNSEAMTIILTDHIRKLKLERNFPMKQNVDKWLEYQVELRDWCGFTFVDICHLGRGLSNIDRLKYAGETLYPTGDDLKDTGNLSEDCNVLLTMFNPADEKYGIETHFGYELVNYPFYRSIHVVESRDTDCPQHIQVNMFGGINIFDDI